MMIEDLHKAFDDMELSGRIIECRVIEGTFESRIFKNENDNKLSIILENDNLIEYAEKCIEHFNSLSSDMINLICKNIIKCYQKFGGINKDFTLPNLENPRDILKYCWFTTMFVDIPEPEPFKLCFEEIAYTISGEGDWEECIGFTIKGDRVLYVGRDEVSPWEAEEYYNSLEDNCLYLED